jgi:hypothetical protein
MEFPKEKTKELDKNLTFLQSDSTASLIKSLWLSYSRILQMGLMEHSSYSMGKGGTDPEKH